MRLLFAGTSSQWRGTETHLVTLARAMAGRGHEVCAVVPPGSPMDEALSAAGLRTHAGGFRNAADPRGLRAVTRAARSSRPEWLVGGFAHEYWPLWACARLAGAKVALFRHLHSPLKWWTRTRLTRLADRFICVSEFQRQKLVREGAPGDRLRLLHNPIDTSTFRPNPRLRAEARAALGVGEGEVLAGFVGSLDRNKGAFTLAGALNLAMRQVPSLRALWVGQADRAAGIQEAIGPALRARHLFRPWSRSVEREYAAMDLLAMPSEWEEVFGRVSVEAQACGVPVVASRIGGLPETLEEGRTGLLANPGDAGDLARALAELAARPPEERRAMGERGARFAAERFAAESIAAEFERLLTTTTP